MYAMLDIVYQTGLGGLEAMSKAGLGGVQTGLGGLEAMSRSIMDNIGLTSDSEFLYKTADMILNTRFDN